MIIILNNNNQERALHLIIKIMSQMKNESVGLPDTRESLSNPLDDIQPNTATNSHNGIDVQNIIRNIQPNQLTTSQSLPQQPIYNNNNNNMIHNNNGNHNHHHNIYVNKYQLLQIHHHNHCLHPPHTPLNYLNKKYKNNNDIHIKKH